MEFILTVSLIHWGFHKMQSDVNVLKNLNPVQRDAVTHGGGSLLILAGAGSGKTMVLTHRVAYLIKKKGVNPYRILAITFTNKAAQEMKDRIRVLIGKISEDMWICTFHAACARILRREIHYLGFKRNFIIYDEGDRLRLVSQCLKDLNLDTKRYPPSSIQTAISLAKDELIDADTFASRAQTHYERIVAEVYKLYQERLYQNNALDFDDLIMVTVSLFTLFPAVLEKYQNKFQYILIDEYQDTNHAQYRLVNLLAAKHRNLCVVGDDDQCLPEGTLISTPEGQKPVQQLNGGSPIIAASGWAETTVTEVERTRCREYNGPVIKIQTKTGLRIRATPNHIFFAKLNAQPKLYYVYLMYRGDLGFRIGITQGVRSRRQSDQIVCGLKIRTNQEQADKIWILRTCTAYEEAIFYEQLFAAKYGIPTMIFHNRARKVREIDTRTRAKRLMEDLMLFEEYPHYLPKAVIRGNSTRKVVNLMMFGDSRPHIVRPWHEHRISLNTSDEDLRLKVAVEFKTRPGRKDTWRVETSRKDYDEAERFARRLASFDTIDIIKRARLTSHGAFHYQPASHLRPGMSIPICRNGVITEDIITDIQVEEYHGKVYDLSIKDLRNYVANGVVVHNSIYGFRGADFRNILRFEEDYPDAKVVTLEQNYRSTQIILEAANYVIRNNRGRKPKTLWTTNAKGEAISRYQAENEHDEAAYVAMEIERLREIESRSYRDFAVFYRTNAQSRVFEEVFMRCGLPYKIVGGLRFYERQEIKDVLAYLRVICDPEDTISLKRIINVPKRGIGKMTLSALDLIAQRENMSFFEALRKARENHSDGQALLPAAKKAVTRLLNILEELMAERDKEGIAKFTEKVLDKTGYIAALEEERTVEALGRMDNIKELLTVMKEFEESHPNPSLNQFLDQISLLTDIDTYKESEEAVTLMTLHNAKGLEFPVVFMVGMEDGVFPHIRSMTASEELEEERRLCYVGVTRAKERLYLTHAWSRSLWGGPSYNIPSRFLKEIPEELTCFAEQVEAVPTGELKILKKRPIFSVGDEVIHKKFGRGKVVAIKGADQITVFFPTEGEKTLLIDYAPLEKI